MTDSTEGSLNPWAGDVAPVPVKPPPAPPGPPVLEPEPLPPAPGPRETWEQRLDEALPLPQERAQQGQPGS